MTIADYNRLIDQSSDKLLRYALKLTGEYNWSQDLVQDSFIKLWINRTKISIDHSKPFLFKVLYNKMIDDQRKRSRTQMVGTLPEKQSDRNGYESQDLLDQAFKHLSDAQKQIILLRDWEGYSYKEIGEILEYNESLVKVHLFRARKEMKRVLAALNNEYLSSNESK